MKKIRLDKSFFYEKRYIIGYSALIVLFSLILLFVGLNLPGGLSQQEIESVITSDSLSLSNIGSFAVPNLPYHILQRASITLLGVSTLSIKLPSLLAALGSAIGLILLLSAWFKPGMAILSTLIIISTGQFLLIAQMGTPDIMYLFWSTWILTLSVYIIRNPDNKYSLLQKTLLGAILAFSLYAPLSIYVILALGLVIVSHPHLRHILKKLNKKKLGVAAGAASIFLLPLIISIIYKPFLILSLLGFPPEWPNIIENLKFLFNHYLNFISASDSSSAFMAFNITSLVMMIIGLYQLIKTRETSKSYLIATWILLLLIPIVIYPVNTNVLYVPLALLIAMGLSSVVYYWYKLFPLNPYARAAGLVPIVILIGSVITAGLESYIYGYRYNPALTTSFSRDIKLLPKNKGIIVVSEEEWPFYNTIARHNNLDVTHVVPDAQFVATKAGRPDNTDSLQVVEIITDSTYKNADRFYIYTKKSD